MDGRSSDRTCHSAAIFTVLQLTAAALPHVASLHPRPRRVPVDQGHHYAGAVAKSGNVRTALALEIEALYARRSTRGRVTLRCKIDKESGLEVEEVQEAEPSAFALFILPCPASSK